MYYFQTAADLGSLKGWPVKLWIKGDYCYLPAYFLSTLPARRVSSRRDRILFILSTAHSYISRSWHTVGARGGNITTY